MKQVVRRLGRRVAELEAAVTIISGRLFMADGTTQSWVQDLIAAVALNATVDGSAIALLDNLTAKLRAIPQGADPNIMAGILADLTAQREALAAAILANTPQEPAPGKTTAPATTTSDVTDSPAHLDPAREGIAVEPGSPPVKVQDPNPEGGTPGA